MPAILPFPFHRPAGFLAGVVLTALATITAGTAGAASIPIPNGSFESGLAPAPTDNPPVGFNVTAWERTPEPEYWAGVSGGNPWFTTVGLFQSPFFYTNTDGSQAAYVLGTPLAGLFQDHSVNAAFDAKFQAGQSYEFTLGLFGKGLSEGSLLSLGLYYLNDSNVAVPLNSTFVSYSASTFVEDGNPATPNQFIDYSVSIPIVQAGDAWNDKYIGVSIQALSNTNPGFVYWDIDHARLQAVPEPSGVLLLALGVSGLACRRSRAGRD